MEYRRLASGLRWTAKTNINTLVVIQNSDVHKVHDNYTVAFPDSETETDDDVKKLNREINEKSEFHNRCYENPLFIPAGEVLKDEIRTCGDSEELMKSEPENFVDYKFCEAVNDFDIELETGEAVPIIYLSTSRAAKLQRALRLGGYKKVCLLLIILLLYVKTLYFPFSFIMLFI